MSKVFIYLLKDPLPGKRKGYVGKSIRPLIRFRDHICEARSGCKTYKNNWLRKLFRMGLKPILKKVDERDCGCKEEGGALEAAYIQYFRETGWELVNTTSGGEGFDPDVTRAAFQRPEVRARKSEALRKAWQRPEVRARKSEAMRAAQNRPEVRARRSEAMVWENACRNRERMKQSVESI